MQSLGSKRSTSAPSKINKNNKTSKIDNKSKSLLIPEITELLPIFK